MPSATTTALEARILQRISDSPRGSISFAEFMAMALYEPELGYYADPSRRIGRRGGDFYTSVSVGDIFGRLLARAACELWRQQGEPQTFAVVEQGAHDGQLARDFLKGAAEADSAGDFARAVRYRVIEPRPDWRSKLGGPGEAIAVAESAAEAREALGGTAGLFLCNELVDALPVHVVCWRDGEWRERRVTAANHADAVLGWVDAPIDADSDLAAEVARIAGDEDRPEGYTTEVHLAAREWVGEIAGLFAPGRGAWWIVDYGHDEAAFYAPERHHGTLRCYREHRAGDDPLQAVGETDLTAHVNFSRLIEWAAVAGLSCEAGVVDQHDFLTRAAVDWLRSLETGGPEPLSAVDQTAVRQFQTLTHPGMMGRVFKVLELRN